MKVTFHTTIHYSTTFQIIQYLCHFFIKFVKIFIFIFGAVYFLCTFYFQLLKTGRKYAILHSYMTE